MTFNQILKRFEIDLAIQAEYIASRKGKAFVLKYEDMINRDPATLGALSDHLGVHDLDTAALDSDFGAEHRTSRSSEESMGKWKQLTFDERELVQGLINRFFPDSGYAAMAEPLSEHA